MNARTMDIAKERQLDWLLGEVLGVAEPRARAAAPGMSRWLVAAFITLALGAAVGTTLLRDEPLPHAAHEPQDPVRDVEWTECHGPLALAAVSADVTALRCFDFDDAACAQLAHFTKLERLDLSGMDVNDRGYSVSLKITDAGVQALGALTKLRWLSLATCHDVMGLGLQALEAVPLLEHLDLTYSGVDSRAIERLPRLPSLRSLVLSHCMNFHGRSLAAVATIPGLQRLELRACTTLTAADALHLAKVKTLRHLDLRDCQGRFRGQRLRGQAKFVDTNGDGLPDAREEPPEEDGVGITDEVVLAVAALPLETLLLGGSESLTDAIGTAIAKMTTLRALDLSELPRTTGALLAKVPDGLTQLALDDNPQFEVESFKLLPPLATLQEFGLSGLDPLDGTTLKALLANKQLSSLRLGGPARGDRGGRRIAATNLRGDDLAALAGQRALVAVDLANATWIDAAAMQHLAALPALRSLDLTNNTIRRRDLAAVAASKSLHSLKLTRCRQVGREGIAELANLRLRELDVRGTGLFAEHVRDATKAWSNATIWLPDGRVLRLP